MPIESWIRSPQCAVGSYYDDAGRLQWQLYGPRAMKDPLEFGGRIQAALLAENSGQGWYREDAVATRGFAATPGVPFVDFLATSALV